MASKVTYHGCRRSYLGTMVPPCTIMDGTKAWELYHSKKPIMKVPGVETLDGHMADCDAKWRKTEGRKPFTELTDREKLMERGFTIPRWKGLLEAEAAGVQYELPRPKVTE